ncbi:MAG TPA: zinc-binding dehydrogenase [Dehalococcoidia bacterium]|nr:zinc-binding dehydrogenase [Dehalococcoidia bacterium]
MKAAVYYETGPPDVFRYEDVPDPVCHPNGVLVDVKAISIEGGDLLNRAGGPMPSRPHIVGYQCAGIIREAGANVGDRAVGQRVATFVAYGSHASIVSAPAASTWLVPEELDLERAACVPIPFGTADDALFEFGHLKAGETVLVHAGAGGVGLAAIQLAKRAGATVLATASSDDKLRRLSEFGLDHGINYLTGDFVTAVGKLTDGNGVDVAVDTVGGKVLEGTLKALAYRGRAILVGRAGRSDEKPELGFLSQGNRSLAGFSLGLEMAKNTERVRDMIARHLEDVARGSLRVVIDRTYPLSEAAAAHAYIESRKAFGRVLLVP